MLSTYLQATTNAVGIGYSSISVIILPRKVFYMCRLWSLRHHWPQGGSFHDKYYVHINIYVAFYFTCLYMCGLMSCMFFVWYTCTFWVLGDAYSLSCRWFVLYMKSIKYVNVVQIVVHSSYIDTRSLKWQHNVLVPVNNILVCYMSFLALIHDCVSWPKYSKLVCWLPLFLQQLYLKERPSSNTYTVFVSTYLSHT